MGAMVWTADTSPAPCGVHSLSGDVEEVSD